MRSARSRLAYEPARRSTARPRSRTKSGIPRSLGSRPAACAGSSPPGVRFVSTSNKRPADAVARQFPHPRPARVEVGADIGIDQIWLAARHSGLDRVAEIAGVVDAHALDTAGPPAPRNRGCTARPFRDGENRSRVRGRRDSRAASRGSMRRNNCSRPPRPPGWRIRRPYSTWACMKNAPSPHTETHGRSGAASLAPSTPATPNPMGPKPMQPISESDHGLNVAA